MPPPETEALNPAARAAPASPEDAVPNIVPNETLASFCQQQSWPPFCEMIPFPQGRTMCEACKEIVGNKENAPAEAKEQGEGREAFITSNPLNLSQILQISKFRSCAGHDYSGVNAQGEKETLRSMKHYIDSPQDVLGSEKAVPVFSPFDGKVTEIQESQGESVYISAHAAPTWQFIFFHVNLEPGIEVGTQLQSGQLVGYALANRPNFDMALKRFSWTGQVFESPFLHMQEDIVEEYAAHGITLENIIIQKEFRDANPCPVTERREQGDVFFAGGIRKEDYVMVTSSANTKE